MKKNKKKPLSPSEVKQNHLKHKFEKAHQIFVDKMNEEDVDMLWDYHTGTDMHYKDDGELYEGDHRKMMLAEIHKGASGGFMSFPAQDKLLYVRGKFIMADNDLKRMKEVADKLIEE
jgi:hypothetical protein